MGYRNLFVESPAALSIKNAQLRVKTAKEFTFPLDDLQSILIDDPRSTVSMTVLSQLGQHNIAVIVSDAQHLPGSVLLPLQGYYHKLTTLNQQLSVTKRFKNRLWQKNIRQKILNQAAVLDWQNLNGVAEMKQYAASVLEGDRTHQEGYAAAFYFRVAFGKHFVRRNDDTVNAALNYGYAIIRSCVARELSAFGFEPALGIFHRNQLNPFNLADDLIEPFRPIVDLQVLQMDLDDQPALTPDIKKQLLNLQSMDVKIDGSFQTVRNAIHLTIESVGAAFTQGKVSGITLPQVIPWSPMDSPRFMRVIVMFDLPVVETEDRKAANRFRHDLISEGFVMMQYSVYYRIVNGLDMAAKYEKRLEGYLPEKGQVRSLVLTEKQFAHMKVLVGDVSPQESNVSGNLLTSL